MPNVPSSNESSAIHQLQKQKTFDLKALLVKATFINFTDLPLALTDPQYPHFLVWKPRPKTLSNNKLKITKPPISPTQGLSWSDPKALKTYSQIQDIYQKYHESQDIYSLPLAIVTSQNLNLDPDQELRQPLDILTEKYSPDIDQLNIQSPPLGIGFVYSADHPFVCIDLDSLDNAGSNSNNELAQKLVSYTEWSPSGDGLHIIVQLPSVADKLKVLGTLKTTQNKAQKRDLYIDTGYVTLTGRLTAGHDEQDTLKRSQIQIFQSQDLIDILSQYYNTVPSIPTPLMKETQALEQAKASSQEADSKKPISLTEVQKYLDEIPVQQLYTDIFNDLFANKYVILDPKCTEEARDPWLRIGQAIHHNFRHHSNLLIQGFQLWNQWSSKGNKYNPSIMESTWQSFKSKHTNNPITIAALIKLYRAQQPRFPAVNKKDKPLPTFDNLKVYLEFYKFIMRLNVISGTIELNIPENRMARWKMPAINTINLRAQISFIQDDLYNLSFTKSAFGKDDMLSYITANASSNHYNPIKDYFTHCGEIWDNRDRLPQLFSSISLVADDPNPDPENPNTDMMHRELRGQSESIYEFVRRWLIQVVASACRDDHSTTQTAQQFSTILIFQGDQGIGKTRWVQSLFPKALTDYCLANKELHLHAQGNEHTKLIMELMSTIICNINEVDTQFTPRSYSKFKSFLDTDTYNLVLPYGIETTKNLVKRTVFIGSTNQQRFLVDPTGNRRVELISCNALNVDHNLDLDQLWGQIHHMYTNKDKWWFDAKDPLDIKHIRIRDRLNQNAMAIPSLFYRDILEQVFDFSVPPARWLSKGMNLGKVSTKLTQFADKNLNPKSNKEYVAQKATLERILHEYRGNEIFIKTKSARAPKYYFMPPMFVDVASEPFMQETDKEIQQRENRNRISQKAKEKNKNKNKQSQLKQSKPKLFKVQDKPKRAPTLPQTPEQTPEQQLNDFLANNTQYQATTTALLNTGLKPSTILTTLKTLVQKSAQAPLVNNDPTSDPVSDFQDEDFKKLHSD